MHSDKDYTLFKSPEDFDTNYALQFNNQDHVIDVEYIKSDYNYDLIKYNKDTIEYINVRYTDSGNFTRYTIRPRNFNKSFTLNEVYNSKTPYGVSIDKDTDLNKYFNSIKEYLGIQGESTLYPIEGNIGKCYSGSTDKD